MTQQPQSTQPPSGVSEALISKLREENAVLKAHLHEARDTITGYREQLDAQHRAVLRHSRLQRLFETLKIPLPTTDDDYLSNDFLTTAKDAIRDDEAIKQRDVALEALKLLLGGRNITVTKVDDSYSVNFDLASGELDTEMAFTISWDDEKIEYNRISIRAAKPTVPQFADEQCIVFDLPQAPLFLAEVLSAVHGIPLRVGKEES